MSIWSNKRLLYYYYFNITSSTYKTYKQTSSHILLDRKKGKKSYTKKSVFCLCLYKMIETLHHFYCNCSKRKTRIASGNQYIYVVQECAEQRKPGTVKINSVYPPKVFSEFLKAVTTISTRAENSSVEQHAERALSTVLRTTSETGMLKCS